MNEYRYTLIVLLILIAGPLFASEKLFLPNTGDTVLDESLVQINKKINKKSVRKLSQYTQQLANDFQIPLYRVEELFNVYEFTAADVLMSVSIADVSGEPLKNVAGLYFKNKQSGWKAVLKQLMISPGSKVYQQIKKDAVATY